MKVAVRTLCDFAARGGDLDHRYTPSPSALEGIEGHRQVAGRRGAGYVRELPLSGHCQGLTVSGRADGCDPAAHLLEEIKTHRGDLARQNPGLRALHWAQLKVYGALYCRERQLAAVTLRLVYYDIAGGGESAETRQQDSDTLWQYLEGLCRHYQQWAVQEAEHRRRRDNALTALRFPFDDFRGSQRALSETVYKVLMTGRRLLLEAPTGIGKTVGTLFPALMAMPRQPLDVLLFLSARNTGRALALEGVRRILDAQPAPVPLRVLELASRQQSCEYPDRACHGESCPLAKGFYDRLGAARQEAAAGGAVLDRGQIKAIAARHQICPYYLTQELAHWCDLVIGDVNYFFDQHALLFALAQEQGWRLAALVDEAHNLPERARAMYSAAIDQQAVLALKKRAPADLRGPLTAVERAWQRLLKHHLDAVDSRFLDAVPEELSAPLQRLAAAITDYLAVHPGDAPLQELLFAALGFLRLVDSFGPHSVCELRRPGRGRGELAIHNLIPADFLAPRFRGCVGAVLFSATLNPPAFYRELLGLAEDTGHWQVASPFRPEQLRVTLCAGISTRLQDRQRSVAPVAALIARQFHQQPGNYLVYLSSFAYLEALYAALAAAEPDMPLRRQTPAMAEAERQQFLDSFRTGGRQVGFAVLGGLFAEGIDLPGDRLNGVFILTLGLPPHDEFHGILRQRLQQRFGHGYEYTYLYPGLRKVVQAAGRVIRTPEDSGVIYLIDDRFARREVRALLPGWWPELSCL